MLKGKRSKKGEGKRRKVTGIKKRMEGKNGNEDFVNGEGKKG